LRLCHLCCWGQGAAVGSSDWLGESGGSICAVEKFCALLLEFILTKASVTGLAQSVEISLRIRIFVADMIVELLTLEGIDNVVRRAGIELDDLKVEQAGIQGPTELVLLASNECINSICGDIDAPLSL